MNLFTTRKAERWKPGDPSGDAWLVYDGDCPFCSRYVSICACARRPGKLHAGQRARGWAAGRRAAARRPRPRRGHGAQAGRPLLPWRRLHPCARPAEQRLGLFNRINAQVFRSPQLSRVLYPVLRAGRNAVLRLLGRTKIASAAASTPSSPARLRMLAIRQSDDLPAGAPSDLGPCSRKRGAGGQGSRVSFSIAITRAGAPSAAGSLSGRQQRKVRGWPAPRCSRGTRSGSRRSGAARRGSRAPRPAGSRPSAAAGSCSPAGSRRRPPGAFAPAATRPHRARGRAPRSRTPGLRRSLLLPAATHHYDVAPLDVARRRRPGARP